MFTSICKKISFQPSPIGVGGLVVKLAVASTFLLRLAPGSIPGRRIHFDFLSFVEVLQQVLTACGHLILGPDNASVFVLPRKRRRQWKSCRLSLPLMLRPARLRERRDADVVCFFHQRRQYARTRSTARGVCISSSLCLSNHL